MTGGGLSHPAMTRRLGQCGDNVERPMVWSLHFVYPSIRLTIAEHPFPPNRMRTTKMIRPRACLVTAVKGDMARGPTWVS